MSEKEISASGGDEAPKPEGETPGAEKEITPIHGGEGAPKIRLPEPRKGALKDKIKDKAAPTEVLDAVLGAPQEELMPWEPTTLPSLGLYYDGRIPDGKVEVRPMGLYADKILATARLAQSGYSVDYLFKNCVRLPSNFDPLDLTLGDRMFLLYYLRGITHGNLYEFSVTCSNDECQRMSTHTYDLVRLYDTVRFPNKDTQQEPFKIVLPHLSEVTGREFWVKVRLLRGRDAQHIIQRQRVSRQVSGGPRPARAESQDNLVKQEMETYSEVTIDQSIEQNFNLIIVEAMGDGDKNKIRALVQKMHAKDTATIREFLRINTPGIDAAIIINCPHCPQELRIELPITESFFRPAGIGSAG